MNAPTITFEVAQRFHGLRQRFFVVQLMAYLAMAVAAAVAFWLLFALGDYVWEWSLPARRILGVLAVTTVVVAFGMQVIRAFGNSRQNRFAGSLEQRFESLGQRLRTVLDSVDGRLKAPEAMLSALGHQTLGRWETVAPTQIIPQRTATVAGGTCLALLTVAAAGLFFPSDWRTALLRTLGQEHPYTTLAVMPGDVKILEGSLISLSLELQGRINRTVVLRYREDGSESWVESELLPEEPKAEAPSAKTDRTARFVARLGKLVRPIDYQFITSIGSTKLFRIEVQHLIETKKLEALVTPPAYTKLDARVFSSAEVLVLEGSQVVVTIETNHPLGEASLLTGEKVSDLQASSVTTAERPTQWTFTLPSDRSLYWQFTGYGVDGTPMKPVKGRMRVRYDEPPRIDWRDPEDEIKVHMLAELPMRAQVSDDYGLTEASIVFQLGDEEEFPLTLWSAAEHASGDSSELMTQVKLDELLPLESFALSERDFVAYYAYAIDNREGREQRVESDVRFIDIRPLRQFFSELDDMPGMGQSGSPVPELDEIIRRQRFLVNRTRKYVRSPNADMSNQLATIERMVESQSELADLTRFLMEFLISRGNDDTEALSQAEASMLQAADSLAVANFPTALAQEEDALRALAEARRSIELAFAKRQTPQSQQEMRRFRRQLQQKLRRTPAKSDQQLADTLKQVAVDQRRLAGDTGKLVASKAQDSKVNATVDKPLAAASEKEPAPKQPNPEQAAPEQTDPKQPDAERPDAAQTDPEQADPEQADPDEAAKELLTRQQDLLERLQAINEGLSAAVKRSPLVEERMKNAVTEMDGLIGKLRENSLAEVVDPAYELADELNELAIHIDALAQPEPSNYVSAMRDMTTSLANMEAEMANSTQQLAQLQEAAQTDEANKAKEGNKTGETGEGGKATPTAEPDSEKAKGQRSGLARMGKRLDDRAATIEDVLKTPIDTSNLAATEVAEKLNKLVADTDLLSQLADSRQALQQDAASMETAPWAEAARERAKEYADVAVQLDQMYRQLVTPRVDLLRQLETQAARVSQQLTSGGTEPKTPSKNEEGKSIETQRDELQKGLQSAGLDDVAEILDGGGGEEGDETDKQGMSGSDPAALNGQGEGLRANGYSVTANQSLQGKLLLVQKELSEHIQELILLEVAADRNAPIPEQYRELVDGYFRSITGEEMSSVEGKMAQ